MHLQYYPVRVNQSSTVSILSVAYSVPSRLIGYTLKAYISSEETESFTMVTNVYKTCLESAMYMLLIIDISLIV